MAWKLITRQIKHIENKAEGDATVLLYLTSPAIHSLLLLILRETVREHVSNTRTKYFMRHQTARPSKFEFSIYLHLFLQMIFLMSFARDHELIFWAISIVKAEGQLSIKSFQNIWCIFYKWTIFRWGFMHHLISQSQQMQRTIISNNELNWPLKSFLHEEVDYFFRHE